MFRRIRGVSIGVSKIPNARASMVCFVATAATMLGAASCTSLVDNPSAADESLTTLPEVTASRPRLYFTAADLPALRQRVASPAYAQQWQALLSWAQPDKDAYATKSGTDTGATHHYIERNAFMYLMLAESNPLEAAKYATIAKNWLLRLATVNFAVTPNEAFEYLWALSIGYDWLYTWPGFTDAEKTTVRTQLLNRANTHIVRTDLTGRFPSIPTDIDPARDSNGARTIYENQVTENNLGNAFPGIALWEGDDKYGLNAEAQKFMRAAYLRLNEAYKALEAHAQNGGYWEGQGYAGARLQGEVYFAHIWKVATGDNIFARNEHLRNAIYHWIYGIRPDGLTTREGDQTCRPIGCDRNRFIAEILATEYRNGYAQWYAGFMNSEKIATIGETAVKPDIAFDWEDIALYDATLASEPPDTLPLHRNFDLGRIVVRTGWNIGPSSTDTLLNFEIHDWATSHTHLDVNSFTLFRRGPLAIDSGRYRGGTANRPHERSYAIRTIAHNTFTVYRPGEDFGAFSNDGGQEFIWLEAKNSDEPVFVEDLEDGTRFDTGTLEEFEAGTNYYYIKGNATDAYHSTGFNAPSDGSEAKISNFTREAVFLSTASSPRMIVFDRIASLDANWQKKWLLHSIHEPELNGAITHVEVPGHITNHNSDLVTIRHNGGKLTSETLVPATTNIRKVGGMGYEFWVDDPGTNFAVGDNVARADAEIGAWRVEITQPTPALDNTFLHVLSLGDEGDAAPPTTLIDVTGAYGAKLENQVTLFSKTNTPVSVITYPVTAGAQDSIQHLLTGLVHGIYHVTQNGAPIDGSPIVASDHGTLRFDATGEGTFLVAQARQVATLTPAKVWVGLHNSDDQGTRFDLRAQVYRGNTLIGEGQTLCVNGVTLNPSKAKAVTIPFGELSNTTLDLVDTLTIKISARIGTTPNGQRCGGHNSAVGLRIYYDAADRATNIGAEITPDPIKNYYAHSNGASDTLDAIAPATDAAQYKVSTNLNYSGDNAWKQIGAWSMPVNTRITP